MTNDWIIYSFCGVVVLFSASTVWLFPINKTQTQNEGKKTKRK